MALLAWDSGSLFSKLERKNVSDLRKPGEDQLAVITCDKTGHIHHSDASSAADKVTLPKEGLLQALACGADGSGFSLSVSPARNSKVSKAVSTVALARQSSQVAHAPVRIMYVVRRDVALRPEQSDVRISI
ncbi:hypothetical protein CPLU01_07012 [Colletotrichum plurivorum]|uniref:Uncharacterized protein n=1 Tax=Colletotrichum plurivorum TaxID=2175906 RepID=A0A8H6NF00_9PEZI|nr:hypothetical protein CPLU01_07012 [Colletotrichum plurivorum]